MICPKCGAVRGEEELECVRCGVIFAKLTPEDFQPVHKPSSTSRSSTKKTKWPLSAIVIVVLLLAGFGYFMNSRLDEKRLDGIGSVAEQPIQESTVEPAIQHMGFDIQPVARYEIRAKVLSVERYRSGRWADISPVDFALGWGPMSDNSITKQLNISQDNRWYHYRWQGDPPIDPALIVRNSANTHIVPANDDIKAIVLKVHRGEIVVLKGYLINVTHSDGRFWRSSLTREDSGDNACELMWVEKASVE